ALEPWRGLRPAKIVLVQDGVDHGGETFDSWHCGGKRRLKRVARAQSIDAYQYHAVAEYRRRHGTRHDLGEGIRWKGLGRSEVVDQQAHFRVRGHVHRPERDAATQVDAHLAPWHSQKNLGDTHRHGRVVVHIVLDGRILVAGRAI